jgi:hypothetical protein
VLRGYFIAMVKFAMFLFTLAAVAYMLEVLGDFSWLEDSFTTTDMGDISMYQMIYWMMTTISTVGYIPVLLFPASYWSHMEHIPISWHPIGHTDVGDISM